MTTCSVAPGAMSTSMPRASIEKLCGAAPSLGTLTVTSVLAGMVSSFGSKKMSCATTSRVIAAAGAPVGGVPPSAPGVAAGALAASRVAWAAASLMVGTRVTSSRASSAPPAPQAASTTSANEAIAIIAPLRRTLFRFNSTSASTTEASPPRRQPPARRLSQRPCRPIPGTQIPTRKSTSWMRVLGFMGDGWCSRWSAVWIRYGSWLTGVRVSGTYDLPILSPDLPTYRLGSKPWQAFR